MKFFFDEKRYSESTGKLHIYCPYRERTGSEGLHSTDYKATGSE
ncbi:MAG: hypothetical protein M0Z64_08385 [Nitrospiraceae bacterium]|jgi:hypothetical protein|nr:hypothetical protein [Nitrospiraceae bacterium]